MFDIRNFYHDENEKITKDYEQSVNDVKKIASSVKKKDAVQRLFFNTASKIIYFYEYEKKFSHHYIYSNDFKILLKENNSHYKELFAADYAKSFYNPGFSSSVFGVKYGSLMTYFYRIYHNYIKYSSFHKLFKMLEYNHLFIKVYESFAENNDFSFIDTIIKDHIYAKDAAKDYYISFTESFNPDFSFYNDMIGKADLDDLRYLFLSGAYISKNETDTARFLLKYPGTKIQKIADTLADSYYLGFKRDNKPLGKRKIIGFYLNAGYEILYKKIFERFASDGFICTAAGYESEHVSEQFDHDHKFDMGLFLNGKHAAGDLKHYSNALELNRHILFNVSGTVHFNKFGKTPFVPENKTGAVKLSGDQKHLFAELKGKKSDALNNYMVKSETSYCIIAFPTPQIGKNYKKIFNEIYKINTLKPAKYDKIQQKLIDALDKADYVHVKGGGGNMTDIVIKMNKLNDHKKETNFISSSSSVNIPLGEVYTSPRLTGTNGILHTKQSYLKDIEYKELKLIFKDGFISDYSCGNHEDLSKNKEYIKENLLFPHETLPMGEFAIGTNTLAYKISKKYGLTSKLPVLIIEKTGPHFAVGDTCFSRREDHRSFSLTNGKEFCAKDNEKSILRKTDTNAAYTNVHTDISLPYDQIEFITAVAVSGRKIDIIRNGLFVLKGADYLNKDLKDIL